jgi:hypothetical protein
MFDWPPTTMGFRQIGLVQLRMLVRKSSASLRIAFRLLNMGVAAGLRLPARNLATGLPPPERGTDPALWANCVLATAPGLSRTPVTQQPHRRARSGDCRAGVRLHVLCSADRPELQAAHSLQVSGASANLVEYLAERV